MITVPTEIKDFWIVWFQADDEGGGLTKRDSFEAACETAQALADKHKGKIIYVMQSSCAFVNNDGVIINEGRTQ